MGKMSLQYESRHRSWGEVEEEPGRQWGVKERSWRRATSKPKLALKASPSGGGKKKSVLDER